MTYSERLSIITGKILGNHQFFTIEQRFYIGICFFSSLAFFISAILNYLIHLPVLMTMACLFLGTFYFIYYYLNRFKIISIHSFWLLFFPCGFFLLPAWFYGGGISGPAMVISIIIIALSSLVATQRQQVYSAGIIVFILGNLFVIEYYYPHLVVQYPSRLDRFTDNYFTIIIAVLITCFVTRLMMTHLKHEREETIKTKKQLIQSEYLFRTLAQTTSTGIMLYQNETCIYANPAAERLSGYGYDELRTMKIWELVSPDQKEMVKALMKMREDGKFPPSGYELKIITRKGEPKQVYVEGNTMEYYGQPAGRTGYRDIISRCNQPIPV